MKKTKLLLTLLCFWVGLLPALAQSVTIVKEMQKNPYANVLVMYKNDFGSFEKPDMSITFPYALIRMQLEGNAHEVKAAKERLTLDMGQLTGVEARITTYSNQKSRFLGGLANPRSLDNKRNTCQTTGKNRTIGCNEI